MALTLKDRIKKHVPHHIWNIMQIIKVKIHGVINGIYQKHLISTQPQRHKKALKRIKNKEKIKVAFFALHSSVWKYDYLYHLMKQHPRFEPVIIICPIVNYGMENTLEEMNKCERMFNPALYNVVRAYDPKTKKYLDVEKEINPDIIFYTNPYKGLIDDRYYITKFPNKLTCYVSYNYGNSSLYNMFHNLEMHNLVWRMYAETKSHLSYSQKYAKNKGKNVIVTGYPGIDAFLDSKFTARDKWKIKDPTIKRIIWAPHHTIGENEVITYSCFIKYADFMLQIATKYQDKIQIAFKPHPLLRVKLSKLWGEKQTTQYYTRWQELSNGLLSENDYIDLFLTSDAMIHDSGSFIIEYLYTKNPVMRTDNGIDLTKEFNPFALDCLSMHYHAHNERDIEKFIVNVINGHDPLKEKRIDFIKNELMPPNGQLASYNILNDIISHIN